MADLCGAGLWNFFDFSNVLLAAAAEWLQDIYTSRNVDGLQNNFRFCGITGTDIVRARRNQPKVAAEAKILGRQRAAMSEFPCCAPTVAYRNLEVGDGGRFREMQGDEGDTRNGGPVTSVHRYEFLLVHHQ
jgi:hypothetical protein